MDAGKSCMNSHCGYKGEVEALIHATAEVDNKWVIEKGLRGRTTSGNMPSESNGGQRGQ